MGMGQRGREVNRGEEKGFVCVGVREGGGVWCV